MLDGYNYDGGYPNLSTAKNIAVYALETSGVDIHSLTPVQQQEFKETTTALAQDLNSFDTTKPCALCGDTGHTFSGCKLTQPDVVQQNYIKLRLLVNHFRRALDDVDKQLDLNLFKHADLNQLETSLPMMLNQI